MNVKDIISSNQEFMECIDQILKMVKERNNSEEFAKVEPLSKIFEYFIENANYCGIDQKEDINSILSMCKVEKDEEIENLVNQYIQYDNLIHFDYDAIKHIFNQQQKGQTYCLSVDDYYFIADIYALVRSCVDIEHCIIDKIANIAKHIPRLTKEKKANVQKDIIDFMLHCKGNANFLETFSNLLELIFEFKEILEKL